MPTADRRPPTADRRLSAALNLRALDQLLDT
jgi:hypothetical protein